MILIGTSGFSYEHWKDVFYSRNLPQEDWLKYYSDYFDTIEINSTFYHLPSNETVKHWYDDTPKDFRFSLKGSRLITHYKKLSNVHEAVNKFFQNIDPLRKKIIIILWQFPKNFKIDIEKLQNFLMIINKFGYNSAFEFRHPSWFVDEVCELLEKYNSTLVVSDYDNLPESRTVNSDFIYIRLHGGKKLYTSEYDIDELKIWANKIVDWSKNHEIVVYFNNDAEGFAIKNAKSLNDLIKGVKDGRNNKL